MTTALIPKGNQRSFTEASLEDDGFWDNHLYVALAGCAVGSLLLCAVLKGLPYIYSRLLGRQEVDANASNSVDSLNWIDMSPTVHLDWKDLEKGLQQCAQEPDDSHADFSI